MRITAARFIGAAARPGQEPRPDLPEVAVAGRSNVGKSSLLNAVLGRRGLARTSRTPGRTRQLNFFEVNEEFRVVDLPGYGFAVGSESEREGWGPLVETYLRERATLAGVIVIVDIRRGLEREELELLAFLAELGRPAALVATKLDKLARGQALAAVRKLEGTAGAALPVVGFSARTGEGRERFWGVVSRWLDALTGDGHKRGRG